MKTLRHLLPIMPEKLMSVLTIYQKMTQKELAKKSGIRQSNLSRIERGVSMPNLSTLQAIAAGLGKKLHIEFL